MQYLIQKYTRVISMHLIWFYLAYIFTHIYLFIQWEQQKIEMIKRYQPTLIHKNLALWMETRRKNPMTHKQVFDLLVLSKHKQPQQTNAKFK